MTEAAIRVGCCIAGGGPAGLVAGVLLARAGVDVLVLEKHADFLRDFRGDTIHPSTLEVMHELGWLDEFLKLPHEKAYELSGYVGATRVRIADFRHLPTRCGFIAMMPQWDFLTFLAERGARYPTFALRMEADVTDLIEEGGRINGLTAKTPGGSLEVRASLVIGADGRGSVVRERAGLKVEDLGAPMDVLWFRVSRRPTDPGDTMGRFDAGVIFVTINRGEHWQCGYVIPKGALDELRRGGLDAFRTRVARLAPFAADRLSEIADWNDVKQLTVRVDRLRQWYRPGLLCIGDAAHAMSPIGGVGVNLAVQDGVATANLLAELLREDRLTVDDLRRVQDRRWFPTRVTQGVQVAVQNGIVRRVLAADRPLSPPLPVRLLNRFALLRRIPARVLGLGIRPEHVRTPEAQPRPR